MTLRFFPSFQAFCPFFITFKPSNLSSFKSLLRIYRVLFNSCSKWFSWWNLGIISYDERISNWLRNPKIYYQSKYRATYSKEASLSTRFQFWFFFWHKLSMRWYFSSSFSQVIVIGWCSTDLSYCLSLYQIRLQPVLQKQSPWNLCEKSFEVKLIQKK